MLRPFFIYFIYYFFPCFLKFGGVLVGLMLFQQHVKSQDLDFILFLVGYRMYVFYESKIKGNNMGQGINSMSFLLKHFVSLYL